MADTEHEKEVKQFLSLQRMGVLSTLSKKHDNYPFGSVVPYDIDEQGRPIIFISKIAEHYRNLLADPRASLIVIDRFGVHDPQAHGRVTLIGKYERVSEQARGPIEESFWKRFPDAPERTIAHDFVFFRLTPEDQDHCSYQNYWARRRERNPIMSLNHK